MTDPLVEQLEVRLEVGLRNSAGYTADEALLRQALARIIILKRELAERECENSAIFDRKQHFKE